MCKIEIPKRITIQVLDEKQTKSSMSSIEYELTAKLYHRGATANSGHYIAKVLDSKNRWWLCDDEIVSLAEDEEEEEKDEDTTTTTTSKGKKRSKSSNTKRGRKKKKVQKEKKSSNGEVYMVVYRRVSEEENKIKSVVESSPENCLGKDVLSHVREDNEAFLKEMESFEKNEIAFASSVKTRKQHCEKAFPLDVVESKKKQKYRWVPTQWLRSYITGVNEYESEKESKMRSCLFEKTPNFAGFCCLVHGGEERRTLLPERFSDMKLISESRLCDLLGTQHVDNEMFPYVESSICSVCEESFKEKVSNSKRVLDEAHDIMALYRSSTYQDDGEPYVVCVLSSSSFPLKHTQTYYYRYVFTSRKFFGHFKRTYLTKLEKYHEKLIKRDPAIDTMICPKAPDGPVNETIQCEHGRIKAKISKRSLICLSKSLFVRLETFLSQNATNHISCTPIVRESAKDDGFCVTCKTSNASCEKQKKAHKMNIAYALRQLPSLGRIVNTKLPIRLERSASSCEAKGVSWLSPGIYLWISRAWLTHWRYWIGGSTRDPPIWPPPELSTWCFVQFVVKNTRIPTHSQYNHSNTNSLSI